MLEAAMNISKTMGELGIDRDNYRALGLLPLVYVAWADGTVQRAEGSLIRRVGRDKGWLTGGGEALLERWLSTPPTPTSIDEGLKLLRSLANERRGFGRAVSVQTLSSLLVLCKEVAEAAGGMWGLTESISAEEEQALATIAEAFGIGDAGTWREIVSRVEAEPVPSVPGPRGSVLVGELAALSRDPLGLLLRCLNDHGDVVRVRIPGNEWFLISHPDHIKRVLIERTDNYIRGESQERIRLIVGKSVLTTEGEDWRALRRITQPAFHRDSLAKMSAMMVRCADEMVDEWAAREQPGGAVELAGEFHRLTLRIIGLALFSIDLRAEQTRAFSEALALTLEYAAGSSSPFRLPSSVPTPSNLRYSRAHALFTRTVDETLAARRKRGEAPPDLLAMLLTTVDPQTGDGLDDDQLRGEVLTYLIAGHETTANALTWLFYALSRHPTVARRVDEELARVLGDATPTAAHLPELEYLEQVLLETMRLYPPTFLLAREVVAEDNIGGFTIPAKSWVLLSPYVTHRRPELWPNPEGFDPERFSPAARAERHACAYLPFFVGPHKCIGQHFAMMEMKLVTATLLQRCRLDLLPGFEPGLDATGLTLRAQHGLMVRPRWREADAPTS
ncbi:cytochrome P450 [Pseudenhygromyxa sp. WMMC2535]|uniref:cytochrome P450 n=1 Tax=Pseudenhygromyxa sp. WMMC2535 TaxID=2712867 RepID=UPI001554F40D|nr:cytochrome P450 [Pseudenhygromyxa sp. WMMC2535]NVB40033.1 cytochrome P450 [Pseudenhygromyxa sp. WMMC2535]